MTTSGTKKMVAYASTAITIGSLKSALLYFDHVIPVNLGLNMLSHMLSRKGEASYPGFRPVPKFFGDIFPPPLCYNDNFFDRLASVNAATLNLLLKLNIQKFGFAPLIRGLSDSEYESVERTAATAFLQFVDEFSLGTFPLDTGDVLSDEPGSESDTVISLASLDLIDAERCSWEQIHEFRRDTEARDKLRRLRLFAYANYQGKSKDFVEDDILIRIADYEAAVKKWGFETAQGALNMLLTSKVIGGALTAPWSLTCSALRQWR
jgi:hypothetical protein